MHVVAVAGGLGDLGCLITDALHQIGKYEVYILSRQVPEGFQTRISPLSGKPYFPILQTDYKSEPELALLLEKHNVHTVLCTLGMNFQAASDSQICLIRAADRVPCVKRFIPSEFNVDYDLGDDIFPYAAKRFHTAARRELERSSLEFAYIYPGMFMDYFGMPNIESHLRGVAVITDPAYCVAVVPGDGESKMSMSFTKDVARYTALSLELEEWPRVMTTISSTISLNDLVALTEKALGRKFKVTHQPTSVWLKHENMGLPSNIAATGQFPEGFEELEGLEGDIGAALSLGAYDLSGISGHLDLVEHFRGKTTAPMTIEGIINWGWKGR